ncbi:hypothetical protein H5V45_18275 [Nocardioides sp. KIGAM211]|uniref:Lysyl oxidase n=1 Tax=Nocardioides luti TaxID=2761101 RepID=A0A7X0VC99_9ACTN|nr:hypothetical protein [Nocardioides luti]
MPRHPFRRAGRLAGVTAALALALPALALPLGSASASSGAQAAPDPASPLVLWAPQKVVTYSYGGEVWSDLGLRVIAQGAPFELWSTRPSYDQPIQTVWRSAGGDVALPAGVMKDFSGMAKFLKVEMRKVGSDQVRTSRRTACLNTWSERVRPDAPATSAYPRSCYYNPYTLGSVQGVEEGWAAPLVSVDRPLHLAPGRYAVTATITKAYARTFGLAPSDATRKFRLVVKKEGGESDYRPTGHASSVARPAAHEPTSASGGHRAPGSPVPDLRSLPAWGIQVSNSGRFLQFSATVWNGGDSPLVVDGFRREDEDEMDAYQYFFDGDGNQTGYQQVGHMHWDARTTHQHWHFEDFARYSLLRADKTEAVRSKKEAFCLANTDAVDQTVPNANWNPENTDLSTSCGDYGSLSIREVLASGWGDTYGQFRAGQSFNLDGLPNGKYYIAVIANPENRLVEGSTANNVSLRKVILGGKPGARTVRVPQVGVIEEPVYDGK